MCGGGGGKAPKVKAAPIAPPIVAPIEADTTAAIAGDQERKRRLAASGRSDTILTGSLGTAGPAGAQGKQLLGQ